MTLRDLPALQRLADELAQAQTAAEEAYAERMGWAYVLNENDAWVRAQARLELLADLSRPDSMDALARLVADWIGWEHWQIGQAIADGGDDWILLCNTVGADWTTMETTPKDDLLGRIALALFGREERAKAIYNGWRDQPGWVPWVEGGNSHKQDEARRLAVLA